MNTYPKLFKEGIIILITKRHSLGLAYDDVIVTRHLSTNKTLDQERITHTHTGMQMTKIEESTQTYILHYNTKTIQVHLINYFRFLI